MLTDARDADPDPLMRVLDLRQRLDGRPFVLQTDEGSKLEEYSFTTDEPLVGGFAAVFKVTKQDREYALKVAYQQAPPWIERAKSARPRRFIEIFPSNRLPFPSCFTRESWPGRQPFS